VTPPSPETDRVPRSRRLALPAAVVANIIAVVAAAAVARDALSLPAAGPAPVAPPRLAASPALVVPVSAVATPVAAASATSTPATDTPIAVVATAPAAPTVSAAAPVSVPGRPELASAIKWAKERHGVVAFAVVGTDGRTAGYKVDESFVTASVVKAMLLTGYLRTHSTLDSAAKKTLTDMIEVSDNNAATRIYDDVGDDGLRAVAKAAGMKDFSVSDSWGYAQLTPADQARFFRHMDRLIPPKHDAFARHLLSHVSAEQSWGIPAVARKAGWTVFFKGGWRGTDRGQLVHQIARLERPGATISIAVMTDGDPSMSYGIATVQGIAARLLGVVSR
jgi:hypothetical protein